MKNSLEFVQESFVKQKFKKHFHQNYSIGLITNGAHKLELRGEKFLIKEQEIKIINPYEPHFATEDSSWQYINFMPSYDTINVVAKEVYHKEMKENIYFSNKIIDTTAMKYFLGLYGAKQNALAHQESLIEFIAYLLENHSSSKFKSPTIDFSIAKSVEYIHDCFLDDIDLETLAVISHLSKYHFLRLFKEKTLLTPHQYIINLRIEYAFGLIQKEMPLSLVAHSCGFSDQSHFTRLFRQRFGFTPSKLMH